MVTVRNREPAERGAKMERSDLPDKLFAEDTLSYPNSVDGERPAKPAGSSAMARGGSPSDEDMLAVEYREDEVRTVAPLEHTPSPEDRYESGGHSSSGADIEDESPPD